jgi:hypothetical protein
LQIQASSKDSYVYFSFRFGGMEFPPEIYFKIYTHTEGKGLTYISGKRVIKAGTEVSLENKRLHLSLRIAIYIHNLDTSKF